MKAENSPTRVTNPCEDLRPDLPTFTLSQIAEHGLEEDAWVSFRRGVYNVTSFIQNHPGGSTILQGLGGSLEPYWIEFPIHLRTPAIQVLETFRIGNLVEPDVIAMNDLEDPFAHDPPRNPNFIPAVPKPYSGEPPANLLMDNFITLSELLYVCNHFPTPDVHLEDYTLRVEGIGIIKKIFTWDGIKMYPKMELVSTLQCAGNRRKNMGKVKPVSGIPWDGGAIGNVKWAGVPLKTILAEVGFNFDQYANPENYHVQFHGIDTYSASLPFSYLLDGNFTPILAYELNGEPLPRDHGFPLRLVLPGIIGGRNVKWLRRIVISDHQATSIWQQKDFKIFGPSVECDNDDLNYSVEPQYDFCVNSFICSHKDGDTCKEGEITWIKGWAFSGGGRYILRVELTLDGGSMWTQAQLLPKEVLNEGTRNWTWTLWKAPLSLKKGLNEVWVKAVDSAYNQQPEEFRNIWNFRGLFANAYHRVKINVEEK